MRLQSLLFVVLMVMCTHCSQNADTQGVVNDAKGPGGGQGPKPLSDKEAVRAEHQPAFNYSAMGIRDPFRSYLLDAAARRNKERGERSIEKTESYDLNQYRLTAVLTGTSQPKAMVEDPLDKAYVVRIGTRLGRAGGRITRIDSKGIQVVEQSSVNGGKEQAVTTLKLPHTEPEDAIVMPGASL